MSALRLSISVSACNGAYKLGQTQHFRNSRGLGFGGTKMCGWVGVIMYRIPSGHYYKGTSELGGWKNLVFLWPGTEQNTLLCNCMCHTRLYCAFVSQNLLKHICTITKLLNSYGAWQQGLQLDNHISDIGWLVDNQAVFEIKGAPCARRAHFRRRVHVFLSCAPGVCTFFQFIIMAKY